LYKRPGCKADLDSLLLLALCELLAKGVALNVWGGEKSDAPIAADAVWHRKHILRTLTIRRGREQLLRCVDTLALIG
jgi:hypothetical protein